MESVNADEVVLLEADVEEPGAWGAGVRALGHPAVPKIERQTTEDARDARSSSDAGS